MCPGFWTDYILTYSNFRMHPRDGELCGQHSATVAVLLQFATSLTTLVHYNLTLGCFVADGGPVWYGPGQCGGGRGGARGWVSWGVVMAVH